MYYFYRLEKYILHWYDYYEVPCLERHRLTWLFISLCCYLFQGRRYGLHFCLLTFQYGSPHVSFSVFICLFYNNIISFNITIRFLFHISYIPWYHCIIYFLIVFKTHLRAHAVLNNSVFVFVSFHDIVIQLLINHISTVFSVFLVSLSIVQYSPP